MQIGTLLSGGGIEPPPADRKPLKSNSTTEKTLQNDTVTISGKDKEKDTELGGAVTYSGGGIEPPPADRKQL